MLPVIHLEMASVALDITAVILPVLVQCCSSRWLLLCL